MRILNSSMQRELERRAVSTLGLSYLDLTRRAAEATFQCIKDFEIDTTHTVILCGPGGNGGDGFALSTLLSNEGTNVTVVLCCGTPKTEVSAQLMREAITKRIQIVSLEDHAPFIQSTLASATLIVDCVFGIGQHRALSSELQVLFKKANESQAMRISVDVPSGVCSDSGMLAEGAFHPEMTVCFLGDKPASVYKESVLPFGKTVTYDLSLPESLLNESPYAQEYSDTSLSLLLPERSPIAHKGTYGKLSVFAGCSRYRGAASIATKAAYLSGVGLVELNSCEEALSSASVFVPEAIFRSFPSPNDVLDSIHKSTAVLAGCGLEQSSFTNEMIESLVSKCKVPLVLDAEALNVVSSNPEMLHGRPGDTILTPHLGEFSRLSGIKTDLIREDRIGYALQFAERYGIYLVLKSENTVIATPDGRFWIDKGGSSGLAKAGSGDLLAGLIAGYVSSDLSSEQAAIAGVLTHSGSSLITEQDTGIRAMTATEVLNHVPRYLAKIN